MIFPLYSFAEDETGIVLITGSNRGIGLEFTKQYLERGWTVIATARKPEKAEETDIKCIRTYGFELFFR